MKWLLLVLILGGEHSNLQIVEFATKEQCIAARDWIVQADAWHREPAKPKAQCFRGI